MSTINIGDSIFLTPTDPREILETIKSFKTEQSTGLNVINSRLLTRIRAGIAQPLSILINKSVKRVSSPTN